MLGQAVILIKSWKAFVLQEEPRKREELHLFEEVSELSYLAGFVLKDCPILTHFLLFWVVQLFDFNCHLACFLAFDYFELAS